MTLYEELTDERGEKYRHNLGGASWMQTPDRKSREFFLTFDGPLQSDTLFLETHNGDNPPIELEKFQLFYPATRILFKARPDDDLFLYYGNPRAAAPRYDSAWSPGNCWRRTKPRPRSAPRSNCGNRRGASMKSPARAA